ncbi:MAG: SDR family oxidoreductase [Terriglobus roseus]|nr:SDR family oxidoreductase [Terriglobus roseus]
MARALALNGAAHVFILGRRRDALDTVAASVPTKNIHPVVCDITSKDSLTSAVQTITSTHNTPAIDLLIANSGIAGPPVPTVDAAQNPLPATQLIENMWAPDAEAITNTYAVNVTGIHFTVAAFLPLLLEANARRPSPPSTTNFRPRPQIITTASVGGYKRRPLGNLSYGPSKAAVMHLSKQLSTVLTSYDVRVNVIAPGLYLSEMTGGMYEKQGKREGHNVEGTWEKSVIPATRGGDEQDMGGVVLWLASRAGAYTSGCVVVTDGGRLAVVPNSY